MLTKDRGPARELVPPHEQLAVIVVGQFVLLSSHSLDLASSHRTDVDTHVKLTKAWK